MNYFWQMWSRKQKLAVLWVILSIMAVVFYGDTFYRLPYERPLYVGKGFAIGVMLGDKTVMTGWPTSKELMERIEASNIKPIGPESVRDEIAGSAWKYDFQLYRAERLSPDGSLIATYGFWEPKVSDEAYTYTVELCPIGNPTLWDRSIGRLFMSEHKRPTPKWIVVDYYTDSDISGYSKNMESKTEEWFDSISKQTESELDRMIEDSVKHFEEMEKEAKDYMRVQNKEVKDCLKAYIKEYNQVGF